MNKYEIILTCISVLTGMIVLFFSVKTLIDTRKLSIEDYQTNKHTRKSKFNEED